MHNNLIYIAGIERRSGTNYLNKLLLQHPRIARCAQPGEDFLLHASAELMHYTEKVSANWTTLWKGMEPDVFKEKLVRALADGLLNYLGTNPDQYLLTKTPSTLGIENFFRLFPNGNLIILIRDGRNLAESNVQSFGCTYSYVFNQWNDSARRIDAFLNSPAGQSKQVYLLKYEDLNDNPKKHLEEILNQFQISVGEYPFDQVDAVPVVGSSTTSPARGTVEWGKQMEKDDNFKPNERFEGWDAKLKNKYNQICGNMARHFKYDTFDGQAGFLNRLFK